MFDTDTVESQTHDDLKESTMAEGELNATLEELAGQEGDLSVDDLRRAAGDLAKDLSDDELQAEWAKAQGTTEGTEEEAPVFTLPNGLKLYAEDGVEVKELAKLTLDQLFGGKYQWGYTALGKEQRKALNEVFRNASLGHYNEQKMAGLLSERNKAHESLQSVKKEHETWARDRQVWDKVLGAYVGGNPEPLKKLVQLYAEKMGEMPVGVEPTVSQDRELEAAGQQFVLNTIVPYAAKLAQEYKADATQITNEILSMIQNEPAEFLTKEKIEGIMYQEIPMMLEQNGYNKTGEAVVSAGDDPRDKAINELRAEIQALKAGQANAATGRAREKAKSAPAAGGGSTPGAGSAMPALKNREQMKQWLRGEIE